MQLRYLVAAAPPDMLDRVQKNLGENVQAPLTRVMSEPRLALWTTAATPSVLSADRATAAVGLVFDRSGTRQAALPSPLPAEDEFVARYWGAYALVGSAGADGHFLLRDPSGAVCAYHRRVRDMDLYASDADLLLAAAPEPFQPDIEFARHWLTFPFLRAARTGAIGVREILPGAARRVFRDQVSEGMHWSPWDHARPARAIMDFGTAAAMLREVVRTTAPLLVQEEQDVIVRLSGGLDSSIVAAALAAAGRHFRGVTFATSAPDGDERRYARQVAEFLSIELAELLEEQGPIDFGRAPACALRPPPNALLQPLHAALSDHLTSTGSDLVLDGAGGDNVFCYLNTASPALDAAGRGRVGAALRSLHHLAALHGTTFWKVARAAARRSRRRSGSWRRDVSFLAPGAAAQEAEDHPWLRRAARTPAGTYEQLQAIIGIRHFLPDPDADGPANLHPLLTQPLIETCLRIPSWLWIEGGRDRAVARAAFADLLPAPILARRSKGRLESMFMRGYMDGRKQIEPLLLEGRLSEAGLLDREAVSRYLRRPEQPSDAGYIRLLELSSAETWLRSFGS